MKKICFLISMFFLFLLLISGNVHAEDKKVIRVGFPIQRGLTEKNTNGKYIGYTVDYLSEIEKYTGWDYEFVEVEGTLNEQLNTLLEMLQKGEIDLLGSMRYSEQLDKIYDYPVEDYGMAYTTLAVRKEDARWISDHFQNWNGIKVGIYEGLEKREQELKKFATLNGFSYQCIKMDSYEELMEAVYSGKVDATLQVDISMDNKLKSIAKFSPVPYYFATTKGNQSIIRELNRALSNIKVANPYLQTTLYEKYFNQNQQFFISEENKKYIQSLGTIKVLLFDGNAPIQYFDKKPKGIAMSYLERFSQATGLKYEVIVAKSKEESLELIQKKKVDLIVCLPTESDFMNEWDIKFSLPFLTSTRILVSNNKATGQIERRENVIYCTLGRLEQLNQSTELGFYLDSYCVNFYSQKGIFSKNLKLDLANTMSVQYAMGLVAQEETQLLLILNNFISVMTNEEKEEIIYDNTIIHINHTLEDFFQKYFLECVVFLLIIFCFLILLYTRHIRLRSKMLNEIVVQQNRFDELSSLMNECLFEYQYETDILNIKNNKIIFQGKNCIERYTEYEEYPFLKELIMKKEDGSYDFCLPLDGENRWYRIIIKCIKNSDGSILYALGKIYNIDEEILVHQALLEKSEKDMLTNLLNRFGIEEKIKEYLKSNRNQGVFLLFDIDNFKLVNDQLGHPEGDSILKRLGQCVEKYFRKEDIKGRLGGDEFLVFLENTMSKEELHKKLEQFIAVTNEMIFKEYKELKVSISIGATFVTETLCTYEELYQHADCAMYIAKHGGKNSFHIMEDDELLV